MKQPIHGPGSAGWDKITAGEAKRIRSKVLEYACAPTIHFYDLALALLDLRECDPDELVALPQKSNLSRRKLYYLLAVGGLISDWIIPKSEAEKIGWTKLQILARHMLRETDVTHENVRTLIELAKQTTTRCYAEALVTGVVEAKTATVFNLPPQMVSQLTEALLAFGAKQDYRGLSGKEDALVRILRKAMGDK